MVYFFSRGGLVTLFDLRAGMKYILAGPLLSNRQKISKDVALDIFLYYLHLGTQSRAQSWRQIV